MKKILIADSDSYERSKLIELLERNFKCDILTASDGIAAAFIIEREKPDAVFFDISLSNADNKSFNELLDYIKDKKSLKVIIVSEISQKSRILKFLSSGLAQIIIKPVTEYAVYQKAQQIFGRA